MEIILSDKELEYMTDGRNIPCALSLEIINRCNVACRMCEGSLVKKKNGSDPLYIMPKGALSHMLEGLPVESCTLAGHYSEPLMHPEIGDIVRMIKRKNCKVVIMTNGLLLKQGLIDILIQEKVNMIYVSLHGARKETAEFIMSQSKYETVVNNLMSLKATKKK